MIGASVAYHLTKLGWRDVVLLERRQLTAGTTWHAAGLITSAGCATESLLWMARYTRDLCISLEAQTGQATGFRPIGHLSLATTPGRLEALRREAAFVRGFGVDNQELSAREFGTLWPEARTDDVLGAFYVADEGRVNPTDLTMAYAKGARMGGARIVEGVTATGFTKAHGRVTGVITDRGMIGAEYVVNAAGMWARQVGAMAGVSVPLQAAEHYYLITDTVEWANPDLPVIEEPDRHGYYREEGGGILVGLFEPVAGPWSLDGVPSDVAFASLPPDWERVGPYLSRAMDRVPALHPNHPQTCGKVERFHQTLKRYLARQPPADSLAILQLQLDAYRHYYNTERPHRALRARTPLEAFGSRLKARPALDRPMTHFRVRQDRVSKAGNVTVRYLSRLRHIGLGKAHAGEPVKLLIADDRVRVVAQDGALIRELVLDVRRDYQPHVHSSTMS